ncbi:MAG: cyanophycin synthetase, partial [Chloroflexota bacterium]
MSPYAQYTEAHAWLFSLVRDPEGKRFSIPKSHAQRQADMEAGMVRSRRFLAFASHPENQFKSVHVTGTSGKGSVSTMIAALLRGIGFSTALHTSPYLQLPTEKLVFNGEPIGFKPFADLIWQFKEIHDAWGERDGLEARLRYTEAWNALTFLWLANTKPDWAVVEAGMGGRLDPTNLLPSRMAVITNVAYDHVKSLGPKLTDIAHHKSGIIKTGCPAVTAVTGKKLLSIVKAEAEAKKAPLYILGRDFDYTVHSANSITVEIGDRRYDQVEVGPSGHYQLANAALAICAVDTLIQHESISQPLQTGILATTSVPGRMEVVEKAPIVLLDGAHNPHKMRALMKSLELSYPDKRVVAIVGGIVNKEISAILKEMVPHIDVLIGTAPKVPGKPAVPPEDVVAAFNSIPKHQAIETYAKPDIKT